MRVDGVWKTKEHDTKHSVFIGNVPFDALEEDLREFFSTCGTVLNVRLIRDRASNFGKGFGFVLFSDKEGVQAALAMKGAKFQNRELRVTRAAAMDKMEGAKRRMKLVGQPKGAAPRQGGKSGGKGSRKGGKFNKNFQGATSAPGQGLKRSRAPSNKNPHKKAGGKVKSKKAKTGSKKDGKKK